MNERDAGRAAMPDEISQEAARAMLAALRLADEALQHSAPRCDHYPEPMSRHMTAQLQVRAAIALAERGA